MRDRIMNTRVGRQENKAALKPARAGVRRGVFGARRLRQNVFCLRPGDALWKVRNSRRCGLA